MKKPSKKQFITAHEKYMQETYDSSLTHHEHEYKTENWNGDRLFVFQYEDGQIEYKDTFHFDGKTVTLFKAEQRYELGARWVDV